MSEGSNPYQRLLSKIAKIQSTAADVKDAVQGTSQGRYGDGETLALIAELLVDVAGLYYGFGKLVDPRDNAYPRPTDFLDVTNEWEMWGSGEDGIGG